MHETPDNKKHVLSAAPATATGVKSPKAGGGEGTDTLVVMSDEGMATTWQSHISNIETLEVSDILADDIEPAQFFGSSIAKLTLASGIDGTSRRITLPDGGSLDVDADAGAATHLLVVSGTGTSDDATLDLASGVPLPGRVTVLLGSAVKQLDWRELAHESPECPC